MPVSVCQEKSEGYELEDRTRVLARCAVPENDLQRLLKKLIPKYGTQSALAGAIGISDSGLTKVLKKGTGGTLSVLNCLRLAKVAGLPASQILRMAEKPEVAQLIDELYGKAVERAGLLDEDNAALWWPDLSSKAKEALGVVIDELKRTGGKKTRKR